MNVETYLGRKCCLSSEIQLLELEEVAQKDILDHPISGCFSTDYVSKTTLGVEEQIQH